MILESANVRATKTKIMYKAYLLSPIKNNFVFIKDNLMNILIELTNSRLQIKDCFFLKYRMKLENYYQVEWNDLNYSCDLV
jgi:hypothetical protein